jgi:hypothetical protein
MVIKIMIRSNIFGTTIFLQHPVYRLRNIYFHAKGLDERRNRVRYTEVLISICQSTCIETRFTVSTP